MANELKRAMIVVWRWADDRDTGISEKEVDRWTTVSEDIFIRVDIRKNDDRINFLTQTINDNFSDCVILLLLHHNSPHNFKESERDEIARLLHQKQRGSRVVFFSGGQEPIYYGYQTNDLGILGFNGKFPYRRKREPSGEVVNASTFILDPFAKRVNQKHFDFVWEFYWYGRRERLLELSEAFRIMTFSYEMIAPEMPAKDFLARTQDWGSDMGRKLPVFAQNSGFEADFDEYNMHQYHVYLQARASELHKESKFEEARSFEDSSRLLRMVQDEMNQLLSSTATGADAMTHFTQAYNNMVKSYISLPEYTQ